VAPSAPASTATPAPRIVITCTTTSITGASFKRRGRIRRGAEGRTSCACGTWFDETFPLLLDICDRAIYTLKHQLPRNYVGRVTASLFFTPTDTIVASCKEGLPSL
jgi:hypothetical protein